MFNDKKYSQEEFVLQVIVDQGIVQKSSIFSNYIRDTI